MATQSIPENRVLQQPEDSQYEDDEAEETLSLSDLPLYSINHHAAASAPATANRHHNRHQEDFEFFSEDFTASTRRAPPESIVFCGKIIHPFRESPEKSGIQRKNLQHSRIGLFQWKSDSWVPKSKASKVVKTSVSVSPSPAWSPPPTEKYQISVEKVSVQYPSKSNPNNNNNNKWYLFKFGLGSKSPPAEMELGDNKTRQSRRRVASGSGLWGLLTSLRCKTSRYLAT